MSKKNFADNELVVFKNSQGVKVRGTLLKLSQNYIVFEVYNPYSIVQLSEVLSDLTITRIDREIYSGKAIVTNIVNTGVILVVSASLSDSNWKDAINYHSFVDLQREVKYLIDTFDSSQIIDEKVSANISAIRLFLSEVRNWFDKLEPHFEENDCNIRDEVLFKYFSDFYSKLTELFRDTSNLISILSDEKKEVCKKMIQSYLHPLIMSAPFPYRAYSKPLGFAGDYMMMYMIQNNSALGPTLYSKFINVFYAHIPLSRSVNNRTDNLVRLISDGVRSAENHNQQFSSLSIGCGPALEVKKFIENNSPKVKCKFNLIDFNKETLDFAVAQSNSVIRDKELLEVNGEINSVHELLKMSVNDQNNLGKYDLVYCSGLFDYLSDRICSKLTKMFFDMLKPGGRVLVTNMHSRDIDRHVVEMILDWYLIYRDEENMASFVPGIGEQKLYTDATGINLCLEILKT